MPVETVAKPKAPPAQSSAGNGKPKKPLEPKDSKFKRLANARVPVAVKRIRHVANLSNRLQYTYTPEQAAKIVEVLRGEVDTLERRFAATGATNAIADLF